MSFLNETYRIFIIEVDKLREHYRFMILPMPIHTGIKDSTADFLKKELVCIGPRWAIPTAEGHCSKRKVTS